MDVINVDRRLDCYELRFGRNEGTNLLDEVRTMEKNSEWTPDLQSSALRLSEIDGPLFARDAADKYHLDYELTLDTASVGTCLMLDTGGKYELLRDTARPSLYGTAKLSGSALGRMTPYLFAATLNNGLQVAQGSTLMLKRYGKVSALHSGADGGYQIMPISELIGTTVDMINRRFGYPDFVEGYNSHGYTSALWYLPDAQERLLELYGKAVGWDKQKKFRSKFPLNAMPALRFASSDTGASCATLLPVFVYPHTGVGLQFTDGVKIRHTKRGSQEDAMKLFKDQAELMVSKFEDATVKIAELTNITVYNPCNAVVSICNKLNIAKKYGEAARVEAERLSAGGDPLTAHDVFICMGSIVAEAIDAEASESVVRSLEENLAKVPYLDWSEHDSGGVVAWGAGRCA